MERKPAQGPVQLPEEVIHCSILPRLPHRTLVRCAAVCRAWRDLILHDIVFATMQARSPSPASAGLARFHNGEFQVVTPSAAAIAPLDTRLSFLPVGAGQRLQFCGCTNGLLCLTPEPGGRPRTFFVCNPATRKFHSIARDGPRGMVGLAYDPAAASFDLVVAVRQGTTTNLCWFQRFSAAAASSGWRWSRWKLQLAPYEELSTKPAAYAGGRLHWLTNRGHIVWYDIAGDMCGTVAPPRKIRLLEGNSWDLGAWRGRIRLCASRAKFGLGVWALASYEASPKRWELVHWRSWCRIPGVVHHPGLFLRSVVPVGMDPSENEAIGFALRAAYASVFEGKAVQVWRRALLCYEPCAGATVTAVELVGKEIHDDFGTVFGYHSSIAALPDLKWVA